MDHLAEEIFGRVETDLMGAPVDCRDHSQDFDKRAGPMAAGAGLHQIVSTCARLGPVGTGVLGPASGGWRKAGDG